MKNQVIRYVQFLFIQTLPFVVFLILFELLLRSIPNDYQLKRQYLIKNASEIEVLYLGNSHTFYGIRPEYCSKKAFNLGHISQSLNIDYAFLKKYESNWKKLKYVIIPLDYFSLFEELNHSDEDWRIKNYKLYHDLVIRDCFQDNFECFNVDFKSNCKRIIKNYLLHQNEVTATKLGYGTAFQSSSNLDLKTTGIEAAKRHFAQSDSLYKNNYKSLIAILNFTRKYNIKPILVSFPTYATYYQNLDKRQLLKTIQTAYNLKTKFSSLLYFNLLDSNYFTKEDFHDGDHLNEIGAKKLTLFLNIALK